LERRPEGTEDVDEQRLDILRMQGSKSWVLHCADLHRDAEARTVNAPRPFTLLERQHVLSDLVDFTVPAWRFEVPERRLTPRQPYQLSPLSYLDAAGVTWSLSTQGDTLAWLELGGSPRRYGSIEFSFRNVDVTFPALVTITADINPSSAVGVSPTIDVQASDAATRSFPIPGSGSHTFDLVVRPQISASTVVVITLKAGFSTSDSSPSSTKRSHDTSTPSAGHR
jgi:hypothetical protein